ncbi:MAG: endonuclease/exonuclease/phosphatase family protein [Muribaculaceae bacterium]|nr:endonuclease/exonuclease/phosphatase family protein [Muribaculaceae bacterium]
MNDPRHRILFNVSIAVNLILAAGCMLSAYGGYFSPDYFHAIPAIALLAFPFWVVAMPCVTVADLITFRKTALIPAVTMVLCVGAFLDFCPIRVRTVPTQGNDTFSLMIYNTLNLADYKEPATDSNTTLQAIIDLRPDIICMQEAPAVAPSFHNITRAQADTFKMLYPNHGTRQLGVPVYSRFKITHIMADTLPGTSGMLEKCVVDLDSTSLTIYNVHLQSIGLDTDDKATFMALTQGHARGNIKKIKSGLLAKLNHAFKTRASQARIIRQYLDADTAENIIVCGDFNDVASCYAIRTIMGNDLMNAYTEAGRGPSATYRANRFYFHIDQILYKGRIKPVEIATLRTGNSDHYPVRAIFKIENL